MTSREVWTEAIDENNKYYVWSIEHNAWWADAEHGYTTDKTKAGIYTFDKAREICKNANLGHKSYKPQEAMVPVF